MDEEAIVLDVSGDIATIMVAKHGECKDCGACPGNEAPIIKAKNPIGARPGQKVMYRVQQGNMVKGAFIVFVLPLVTVALGTFIGSECAAYLGVSLVAGRIVGALLSLVSVVLYVRHLNKAMKQDKDAVPVIVSIKH